MGQTSRIYTGADLQNVARRTFYKTSVCVAVGLVLYFVLRAYTGSQNGTDVYVEDNDAPRTYDPSKWTGMCRNGRRQSPVDLAAESTSFQWLEPLKFENFEDVGPLLLENTGLSVQLSGFADWTRRPSLSGGDLKGVFYLVQTHFHWGQNRSRGSEHGVNGLHYPAEAHLVFSRSGHSPETLGIRKRTTDLTVLSVLLNLNNNGHALQELEEALGQVVAFSDKSPVYNFAPRLMLPASLEHFYRYTGSLTTPPCTEGVIWTVLATPLGISENQLDLLRRIQDDAGAPFQPGNFRAPQPLNGRELLFKI